MKTLTQYVFRCNLFNARSLVNKLSELHHLLYTDTDVDCLLVTETWLHDEIPNGLLDPKAMYNVLRCDRIGGTGGGVCVLIRRSFQIVQLDLHQDRSPVGYEVLAFDCIDFYVPYRIFVVYRPPTCCSENNAMALDVTSQLVSCIEGNLNKSGPTIIFGDFNCPGIDWQTMQCAADLIQEKLYDFVVCNGFMQYTPGPTRLSNTLDLVFVNDPLLVSDVTVVAPFSTSDHSSVIVDILCTKQSLTSESNEPTKQRIFKWKCGDYVGMCLYLKEYNWSDMFAFNLTADDLWHAFCEVLDKAIELFVPSVLTDYNQHTKTSRTHYPKYIHRSITRKRCLWRQHRRFPDNHMIKAQYCAVSRHCKAAIEQYERSLEEKIVAAGNSGEFFKYINKRLGYSHDVGLLKNTDGTCVRTNADKADVLNLFFSSVNVVDNGVVPELPARVSAEILLDYVYFDSDVISRLCKKIKSKSSKGPDGYSSYLLKQIVPAIAGPIGTMFQSFMSIGKIPREWKTAIITPIFKKGVSSEPSNYRPVSLTSVFCKLMERVIALDLINYLNNHKLINKQQHGFLKNRCTDTNLLEALSDWTLNIENSRHQTVAYVDFAKAFDSVCHNKLLLKLKQYGICGLLLEWIRDFLTGRTHRTKVGNAVSNVSCITSGVIQGSCLGPVLFLIYVNDLVDIFTDGVAAKLYADDVKLYSSVIANEGNERTTLQENLYKLAKWANDWQLPISLTKCYILEIGKDDRNANTPYLMDGTEMKKVDEVADLGVLVDNKLKFSNHVVKIVSKAHRYANLIIRTFKSRDPELLVKAFNVYVRPVLEYCSVIWNPYFMKDIIALERVQRRFTKRLAGMKGHTYYQRLSRLKIESLEIRRIRLDLLFAYKLVFGLLDVDSSQFFTFRTDNTLRGHAYKLYLPYCKSSVRYNFFNQRVIRIWNTLPTDKVDFQSIYRFKATLTNDILIKYCKLNFI